MVLVKILFILLIVVCLFFRILYIWDFSAILPVIACAVPVFFFLTTLILKFSLKFSLSVSENPVEKDTPFNVTLTVMNRTFIPVPKADAFIEYENTANGDINEIQLYFPIQSRNTQKITFQLSSKFCGKIKIRTAYIMIYDPLRIFKAKVAKKIETDITVMPSCHDIGGYMSNSFYVDEESNTFSQHHSGDDPSEVFDLHEYKYGDRLNRIHWKLSSKKEDFIVKDLSLPINEKIILFPDIRFSEISEVTLPIYDTAMECLMSLSFFLLENESPHYIINFNQETSSFDTVYIDDLSTLSTLIFNSINSYDINSTENLIEKFFSENPELCCSSFTLVSTMLSPDTVSIMENCIESDIKNIIYTVESSEKVSNLPASESVSIITAEAGKLTSSVSEIYL